MLSLAIYSVWALTTFSPMFGSFQKKSYTSKAFCKIDMGWRGNTVVERARRMPG